MTEQWRDEISQQIRKQAEGLHVIINPNDYPTRVRFRKHPSTPLLDYTSSKASMSSGAISYQANSAKILLKASGKVQTFSSRKCQQSVLPTARVQNCRTVPERKGAGVCRSK